MRALYGEFVRRTDKRQSGEPRDLCRRRFREIGGCIDPGADRGATERQPVYALQRILHPLDIVAEHPGVAGPFLAQGDRRGVLHMRAADLDDVVPGGGLRGNGVMQPFDRRDEPLFQIDRRRDVHGGWKRIVRRL